MRKIDKRLKKAHIIAVDLDGTLCNEICYSPKECCEATPRLDIIKKINELSKNKYIVVYTARRPELLEATYKWLNKHNVRYQAVSIQKTAADLYIDDKMIDVEEFKKW